MAETPQFKETQPILTPQKVESHADSYEAFAKTLSTISKKSGEKVEELATNQSNTMYLSSLANVDDLKLSTQEAILTDPAHAMKHVETLRDSLSKVNQIAYVNKADRQKLTEYSRKTANAIELDGIQATVKQSQIGAAFEHYENWPTQLNILKDIARTGDKDKLDKFQQQLLGNLESLVKSGSLTPLQGGNAIKSMSDIIDMEKDVHEMIQNVNGHSPENFHSALSNPIDPNKANNLHYPVDENTNWLVNYHASDRSFQAAQDDVQQHKFNVEAYENLNAHQRNEIKQQVNGVRMADGLINSNASLPKIQSRISDLEGRTDYGSLAEKKNLKQYVTDLKNGNSERLMARTTIGGRIVRDYTDTQSYLSDKLKRTNPQDISEISDIKAQMAKNKNQYVNNSIAYSQAHHWPVVHPIPKEDVALVQNGFNVAGDPGLNAANAYSTFSQYTPQNQMYFADQMKNPRHKVVLQTIALGKGNTQQEKIDFIAANQNRNYKEIDAKTGGVGDNYLKNVINTKITDAIKIINGQNDPVNATILNEQLIGAGVNYAKFISEKNGQYSLQQESTFNSINNVSAVTSFINKSYEPMSGANYIINKAQNDIDRTQMDSIAQYAINEGNKYLRNGMSESAFIELTNKSPLTVTITPTNIVQAKDVNGNVMFSSPMSSNLVSLAESEMKKMKSDKAKAIKGEFKKAKQNRLFLSPEEQFVNVFPGVE